MTTIHDCDDADASYDDLEFDSTTLATSPTLLESPFYFSPGSLAANSTGRAATYISGISVLLSKPVKGAVYLKLLLDGHDHSKLPFRYKSNTVDTLYWRLDPFFTLRDGHTLVIQLRKRRWPKAAIIAEATVHYGDVHNYFGGDDDDYRKHIVRDDPSIILDLAPDSNPLHGMLARAAEKADEVKSVLDHLGKSKRFLQTLLQYGVAISELDPVAKAILGCVNVVSKKLKEQDKCDKLVVQLAECMARTLDYIEDVEQFARITQLKKAIEEVYPLMEDTTNFIIFFIHRSRTAHLFNSSTTQERLDGLVKRFDIFKQQFDRGVAVQSGLTLENVLDILVSGKDDSSLQELRPRGLENRTYAPECMEGTRLDILGSIEEWIDDMESPNILWIRGFPGVGKSAIASTLTQRLRVLNRLGSNFVSNVPMLSPQPPTLFGGALRTTLLAITLLYAKVVIERLDDDEVDVDSSNIKTIFRNLIEAPLKASNDIPTGRLPVIVVDALDECSGHSYSQHLDREGLLSTLVRWSHLPRCFKLIVTSRGDDDITRTLTPIAEILDLSSGNHVKTEASADIHLFLHTSFAKIASGYPDSLPPDWPGDEIVEELTARAAGLFIWAKTLVSFVNEGEPVTQLRQILNDGIGLGDVSILYARVLDTSFRFPSPEVLESFRVLVGTVVFAKLPLSKKEYIDLLDLQPSMVDFILKGLHSVMDEGRHLHFNHQSFVDFLLDSYKCPQPFHISEPPQHFNLTQNCLRIMNERLHFDMCEIPSSHVRNHQIPDIEKRIYDMIGPALIYACRFWVEHLRLVPFQPEIFARVKLFLEDKLLFWFEVLSLTNDMDFAAPMISHVLVWCQDDSDAEFKVYLQDAIKFIAAFGGVMSQSAPHIYLSALPFAPSQSRVSQRFLPSYPGTLKLQSGQFVDWPRLLFAIEEHEGPVNSISFSRDGKFIVSGAKDRTVCVWNAETGDLVSTPLEGHISSVNCVTFSADGRKVVSCSDDWSIRMWDAESGDPFGDPLLRHTNVVTSVVFAQNDQYLISSSFDQTVIVWDLQHEGIPVITFTGHRAGVTFVTVCSVENYVASSSLDRTIIVWDMSSGQIIFKMDECHTLAITSLAFSPDGGLLASASEDKTIHLWNMSTGYMFSEPLEGHSDGVSSITFSLDGLRLLSGSHDETLRIWDVDSGQVVVGPFRGHTNGVTSVAFSPDGRRIVSGSRDETIRVWDAEPRIDENVHIPFDSHKDGVTSVRFTPDGQYIASGSDDETVRLWDANTGRETLRLEGHSSWVETISISPDNRWIASGSDDQTICVWDLETGTASSCTRLLGHRNGITSIQFFPDSRRLVTGSYDESIRVWDVERGACVLGPIEPHSSWVTTVAVSPDGFVLASGSYDKTIQITDANSGFALLQPLEGHSGVVNCLSFSPSGEYLASASNDRSIRLWDPRTGQCLHQPFTGHSNFVLCLAFSPDSQSIVTGSVDKTVRIWDIDTGQVKLGPLEGHIGSVFSVQFSPDGKLLATASEDETIRLWDVSSELLASELAGAGPIEFADDTGLQSGWIAGPNFALLFYVPPWHRAGLWWPRNTTVVAETPTKLDLSRFENGYSWQLCRDQSAR